MLSLLYNVRGRGHASKMGKRFVVYADATYASREAPEDKQIPISQAR